MQVSVLDDPQFTAEGPGRYMLPERSYSNADGLLREAPGDRMSAPWHGILFFSTGKALRYVLTLLVILSLNFIIPRIMPGDPMINLLGEDALRIDVQVLDGLRARYGLDKSLLGQYTAYLQGIAGLDLGFSIHKNVEVRELIARRLPWTLLLVAPSLFLGGLPALLLGSFCGYRRGSLPDRLFTSLATLLYTIPAFLLAMILVSLFSFHLGWFPLGSLSSGEKEGLWSWVDTTWHLCLPVGILAGLEAAQGFIIMRGAAIRVAEEYHVLVARAKGLSTRVIVLRHVMRSVMPPFISLMALNFGFMVGGAVVLEIVFSLNGMGTLIYDAVKSRDYPVMQGAFLVLTLGMLGANFLADLLYGVADPRIADSGKYGGRS